MTDERHHTGDINDAGEQDVLGDETLSRAVLELRALPEIDPAAKALVLVAVAAERSRESHDNARRRSPLRIAAFAGLAAALLAAVILAPLGTPRSRTSASLGNRGASLGSDTRAGVAPSSAARPASVGAEVVMVPVQLVVRAPAAKHVAVVGDFTGWDEGRVAMTRDAASGLWSATISVRPGRHVYAFVADDSVWMRDPRAPIATDSDFGRPGSVLLVGRP